MKTYAESVPDFGISNLSYTDEYTEPVLTFEQEEEIAEMMELRKTAECGMCFGMEDPDNMTTRYFYYVGKRYEVQLCSRCCDVWDRTSAGSSERCIVCRTGCSVPGDDCVEVIMHSIPSYRRNILTRGMLCAECCDAWEIAV